MEKLRPQKKIFVISLLCLTWLSLTFSTTYALFNDSVQLATNTISTGTTDLLISNSQSQSSTTYADVRPGFNFVANPGESDEKYFLLRNNSTGDVAMDINMSTNIALNTANILENTTLQVVAIDSEGKEIGTPAVGIVSSLTTGTLSIGVTIPPSTVQRFKLKATLAKDYAAQGASGGFDVIFTGYQHSS